MSSSQTRLGSTGIRLAVARHNTVPMTIPPRMQMMFFFIWFSFLRTQGVQVPPEKKGVTYAMIKPSELRIAQVMMMRFSHARDSSTVFPDLLKFIRSRATAAVTTAAMVEIPRI